ncbi:hypothetical protein [Aliamphritea spongicola]|nr:hypothetical protein [Aliamphritea spongicola]
MAKLDWTVTAGSGVGCILGLLMSVPAWAIELNVQVLSTSGEPLEDMVVYAEPLDGQQLPATDKVISVGQKGKSFAPYVSVSQAGNDVLFDNQDDITHHIYSVDSDARFSFKIKAGSNACKAVWIRAEKWQWAATFMTGCPVICCWWIPLCLGKPLKLVL